MVAPGATVSSVNVAESAAPKFPNESRARTVNVYWPSVASGPYVSGEPHVPLATVTPPRASVQV
jgi:hypothetical protein